MRKAICVLMMLALICLIALPAQADRLKDLGTAYDALLAEKVVIEKKLFRLEGRFAERQEIIKEAEAAKAEEAGEAAKAEEEPDPNLNLHEEEPVEEGEE